MRGTALRGGDPPVGGEVSDDRLDLDVGVLGLELREPVPAAVHADTPQVDTGPPNECDGPMVSPVRRSSVRMLLLCSVVAVLSSAATADALTTASRSGNTIRLDGNGASDAITGAGGRDSTTVLFTGRSDSMLRAGRGCHWLPRRPPRATRDMACGPIARPANPLTVDAKLAAGDDQLNLGGWLSDRHPRAIVDAGDGNDKVTGTILADEIRGGDGDDQLAGRSDIDLVDGGVGNDVVSGDGDSDHVIGGLGVDQLWGDGVNTPAVHPGPWAGGDTLDANDFPTDLTGITPGQLLTFTPRADHVSCGPGPSDIASVDAADSVDATCEARTGANPTPEPDRTEQLPYEQVVGTRPSYTLVDLNHGEPLRFLVTPSTTAFIDAKVTISAADARRFGLGRNANARYLAAIRPVLVQTKTTVELFLRIDWPDRPHLRGRHNVHATLTVRGTHQGASGPTSTESRREIVLR